MSKKEKVARAVWNQRCNEYAKMSKTPLRVDINLRSPLMADFNVCMDGILSLLVMEDMWSAENMRMLHGSFLHGINIPLPIAHTHYKRSDGKEDWFFDCSVLFGEMAESIYKWKKRFEEEYIEHIDFNGNKEFIRNTMGFFKSYNQPMIIKSATSVYFYCLGNAKEINRLLSGATHIGKKAAQGFGAIRDFTVSQIDRDLSVWSRDEDGNKIPQRFIPLEYAGEGRYNLRRECIRPPYWDKQHAIMCVVP